LSEGPKGERMTTQTKNFIELSDIIALRIDCKKCKTISVFPFEEFRDIPQSCPNCEQEFIGFNDNVTKHTIRDFMKAIRAVSSLTEKGQFSFSMEIANVNSDVSSGRASGSKV
jgi:hypothetical protein